MLAMCSCRRARSQIRPTKKQEEFKDNNPDLDQFTPKKVNMKDPCLLEASFPAWWCILRGVVPASGDRIVGIVTTGRGVTVHTMDCDTLVLRIRLNVGWRSCGDGKNAPETQVGRILMTISNEPGALGTLKCCYNQWREYHEFENHKPLARFLTCILMCMCRMSRTSTMSSRHCAQHPKLPR